MLSFKRLMYIIFIAIVASLLFLMFNLNSEFFITNEKNESFEDELVEYIGKEPKPTEISERFLVVGVPTSDFEKEVRKNVLDVLDSLKIQYRESEDVNDRLFSQYHNVIFVVADIRAAVELEQVADFVQGGGGLLFAAGLPAGDHLAYLNPIFGITEKGGSQIYSNIKFNEGSVPYGEILINDAYPSFSNSVRLAESCRVILQSDNRNPLVWTNEYRGGHCTVINGTFMESPASKGIFITALSDLEGSFIYPIINAKLVYLDAIPPIYTDKDAYSFKHYGRSAESFIRDRLWAIFVKNGTRFELRYTSSFLGVDKNEINKNSVNSQTFSFINKEIIRGGGEVTLSGNHNKIEYLELGKVVLFKEFFESVLPDYNIRAYYPLYGKCTEDDFRTVQQALEKINIFRTYSTGEEENITVSGFEAAEGIVKFPTTSTGYYADGRDMYAFLSTLTTYGVVSHSFDINKIFEDDKYGKNWNDYNKDYEFLCEAYFGNTPWLENMTISPAAKRVEVMHNLEYNQRKNSGGLLVTCEKMVRGQSFMLYSTREVKEILGATFEKIAKNHYIVKAEVPQFEVIYE